jgi:hypothetical protein
VNNIAINYCNIYNNSGYGVGNFTPDDTVYAENNWWGHPSGPGGFGPGTGDSVSQGVNYIPWLTDSVQWVGVEEEPITTSVEKHVKLRATIFRGPLQLPEGKQCKVYDITGRVVAPDRIQSGIYFIEVDGVVTQKVVKIR